MIFPENKRYNCKSQEIITLNKKFSTEHNLPDFTHVLIPKIEITHACLCSFLSKLNCVYDVTIAYRDCTKTSNNISSGIGLEVDIQGWCVLSHKNKLQLLF